MKFIAAVLILVAVASAASSDRQQVDIAKTARQLQSIGHMAVVDTISPLHVAISTLVSKIDKLQNAASQQQIQLPQIDVPQVELSHVFTCQSQSQAIPKFTIALQYMAQKSTDLRAKQQRAMRLASGLDYVIQKVNQKDIDNDTLQAVVSKLNQFLGSYAAILSEAVNAICNTSQIQQTQSDMDSPLSVFYRGCPWGGAVC
uniref:Sperm-activating peptide n=1 Tax=Diadema savignyi TaxID=105360 RepID=A0A0D4BGW9_DIASA|nr:sperm-activating peptide [Diadema savignyi]AJT34993.1 sperm-activating peptide [Diadema savignyi]